MVGTDAIPNLHFSKKLKYETKVLPVLPSDHYGLFLKLQSASAQAAQ